MRLRSLLILLFASALAGLVIGALLGRGAGAIDQNQARICRMIIPALVGERAPVVVTRMAPGPSPKTVRIDYRVDEAGVPSRGRQVLCAFAGEGLLGTGQELVAVFTERGRMSDASLYFLRRFWLDQPESLRAIPPPPASPAILGRAPAGAAHTVQHAAAALPLMSVTGLMATAYALVYGLVGRIVLAFGEFAALGAAGVALGVALAQSAGAIAPLPLLAAGLALGGWIAAAWGAAAARFVLAPMLRRPGQHVLIATVGLALAISEGIRLTQGPAARWLAPIWNEPISIVEAPGFVATTTPMALGVALAAIAAAALLVIFMRIGPYGRAWRACADDAFAAALCGVDFRRVIVAACALACGVAGLSGFLLTLHIGGMGFAGGAVFGLKALVGAILGGVGSVGGALAGGVAVGALEALWSATMPIEWRDVAVFSLLSVVLILRPGGLFGDAREPGRFQGRGP